MNAKHSAILLSGLLLLMIGIAWAEGPNTHSPTCPAISDDSLQAMLIPTAWARADWNAKTSRWEIDCSQMDSIANMPVSYSANAYNTVSNATSNAANSLSPRRRSRGNGNTYINSNPYDPGYNSVSNAANAAANGSVWAVNAAANAVKSTPTRRPARRRPGM